jgi:hypothetical protein
MKRWRNLFGYTIGFGALGVAAGIGDGWLSLLSYPFAAAMGALISLHVDRGPDAKRALGTGLIGIALAVPLSVFVAAGLLAGIIGVPVGIALWTTSLRFAAPWFALAVVTICGYLVAAVGTVLL